MAQLEAAQISPAREYLQFLIAPKLLAALLHYDSAISVQDRRYDAVNTCVYFFQ